MIRFLLVPPSDFRVTNSLNLHIIITSFQYQNLFLLIINNYETSQTHLRFTLNLTKNPPFFSLSILPPKQGDIMTFFPTEYAPLSLEKGRQTLENYMFR